MKNGRKDGKPAPASVEKAEATVDTSTPSPAAPRKKWTRKSVRIDWAGAPPGSAPGARDDALVRAVAATRSLTEAVKILEQSGLFEEGSLLPEKISSRLADLRKKGLKLGRMRKSDYQPDIAHLQKLAEF